MTNYDCLIVVIVVLIVAIAIAIAIDDDAATLKKTVMSAGTAVVRTISIPIIVAVNATKKHKWNY